MENAGVGAARAMRDVARELRALLQAPPEGIRLLLSGDDADCISTVHAEIDGPVGTPYEGGLFRMKLEFGAEFPSQPPKGAFVTRIFHPNIAKNGEICVNTLKRDWKPTLGLRHILLVIRCLLIEPYPESALNEEAGKLLLQDYAEYAHHARLMTSIHALPRHAVSHSHSHSHSHSSSQPAAPDHLRLQKDADAARVGAGSENVEEHGGGEEHEGCSPRAGEGSAASAAAAPAPAAPPSPLALNSSIANNIADGDPHALGLGAGRGAAGVSGHGSLQHQPGAGEPGKGSGVGAAGAKEKKKVDSRKKALKRL